MTAPRTFAPSAERRVAVVTGAAQGIGRATAVLLASSGYSVVLCDRRPPDTVAAEIERAGGHAVAAVGDVCDDHYAERVAVLVREKFGRVDVLVNNAGISLIRPAQETTGDDLRRVLEVNLVAPFVISRALGGLMLERRAGSIVNVASIAGIAAVSDRAAYNASKHGLVGLTRTLAAEWRGYGVRCNAVCPGWVKTEMDVADQSSGNYADDDIIARVPMGRFATPGDIAHAIAYLCDPVAAAFVNGQTLVVDGGWTSDASWERLRLAQRP